MNPMELEPIKYELLKSFKDFLKAIGGPATEEMGLILGDSVREWRLKRQIKIIKRAQEMISNAGLTPNIVSMKVLAPLLGNCILEDDIILQEKWAGLLATAVTTIKFERFGYIDILKQISPLEAKLLDIAYDWKKERMPNRTMLTSGFTRKNICRELKIFNEEFEIMADNLFRLNLFQPAAADGASYGDQPFALRTYDIISLTQLGFDFVKSCRGPNNKQNSEIVLRPISAPRMKIPPARYA